MRVQSGCPFIDQQNIGGHAPEASDRHCTGRPDSTWAEARAYMELYHREKKIPERLASRLEAVRTEIESTGTYWQTADELAHGARVCLAEQQSMHRTTVLGKPPIAGHAPPRDRGGDIPVVRRTSSRGVQLRQNPADHNGFLPCRSRRCGNTDLEFATDPLCRLSSGRRLRDRRSTQYRADRRPAHHGLARRAQGLPSTCSPWRSNYPASHRGSSDCREMPLSKYRWSTLISIGLRT